jgi:lincosamide and streptogramin A transport system ATP-binding/permease protein
MDLEEELLARCFATLSGGEQTRALIVALFLRKGIYPLLDEPTNHLDIQGRIALSNYLASKQGFLVVSHDRYFLDGCVDHIISINRSGVRVNQGNYSTWKQQSDLELEYEIRQNEKLKREIRQLKKAAQQRRDWSDSKEKTKLAAYDRGFVGHKAAKQMKRALVIEERIQHNLEEKQQLLKNYEKERILKLQSPKKVPEQLLRIQDLTVKFRDKTIFEKFSLSVCKGERIAIIGGNGSGKTTLFNVICGTIDYHSGTIDLPGYLKLLRTYQVPRWQSGFLREYLQAENVDETRFRQILGVLNVEGDIFDRPLESYSQGQLKKVDLCLSFMSPAHLMLWDEPLNYIDILSREQIEQVVLDYSPTLLFIEHDKYFVDRIATDVVIMD